MARGPESKDPYNLLALVDGERCFIEASEEEARKIQCNIYGCNKRHLASGRMSRLVVARRNFRSGKFGIEYFLGATWRPK